MSNKGLSGDEVEKELGEDWCVSSGQMLSMI